MTYRPREAEDYLYGSSDKPKTAGARPELFKQSKLEEQVQHVQTLRVIDHNSQERKTNVDETNKERIAYALRTGLKPVLVRGGVKFWRRVSRNKEGLVKISYTESVPNSIAYIDDGELLPLSCLFNEFDFSEEFEKEVRSLIGKGKIRGTRSKINLVDLNNYIAELAKSIK